MEEGFLLGQTGSGGGVVGADSQMMEPSVPLG